MILRLALILTLFVALGCDSKPKTVPVEPGSQPFNYLKDVKPILDARCVVCHSCYDAPCQLKLSSYEGLDRGGSKIKVYDGLRLEAIPPTRLFQDATSTSQWRKKGFYSVTSSTAGKMKNNSQMLELLNLKKMNPKSSGDYHAGPKGLSCPKDLGELGSFMKKHPNRGMPFGFPPLNQDEFTTIARWLQQGAPGPSEQEQQKLMTASPAAQMEIRKWEGFFNNLDVKHVMSARYLYEHLFLAHIYFPSAPGEFFHLVRSKTPFPDPIRIISTLLPYDDPGVERFYYRFSKIHSTIVHKNHIVFTMDDAKLERIQEIFIKPKWVQPPHVMSYDPAVSANPFANYKQIPAKSRYEFLLDNSEYIMMNFIRGPVCKGNLALDVIQDHFWILFLDPKFDLSVQDPKFLTEQTGNLRAPIVAGVDPSLVGLADYPFDDFAINYYKARDKLYTQHYPQGMGYEAIWPGYQADDAPIQTIYRHYNNASVTKGVLGNLPRTLWVVDYPIFERIYYDLVAGFDVYGDITSQVNIRRYMDRLRIEGESNFLDFMPKAERKNMFSSWYDVIDGREIVYYNSMPMPTGIKFNTTDPKSEMITHVVEHILLPSVNINFDPINYFQAGQKPPPFPKTFRTEADFIQGIRAIQKPGLKFLQVMDGGNANLAFLRIRFPNEESLMFTLVVNRWHANVAYMLDEKNRLDPAKDVFNIIPQFIGSYPNFLFDVELKDLPDFFVLLQSFQKDQVDLEKLAKYGVARSDADFWEKYDWFQDLAYQQQPVQAGLFDLSEYYYRAF